MPILSKVEGLSEQSHQKVEVECDLKIVEKCRNIFSISYRDARASLTRNSNKILCFYCSHRFKYSGRGNPNCKYKTLDDNFFKNINTDFKAYLLGWICSDGCVSKNGSTISIKIKKDDFRMVEYLRDNFCEELPIVFTDEQVKLVINSNIIVKDVCYLLKITPGKKSNKISFPKLETEQLTWAFIRGVFDGDGAVSDPNRNKKRFPVVNITSSSPHFLKELKKFTGIPGSISSDSYQMSHNNALDFLGKIYEEAPYALQRKLYLYHCWCCWEPSLKGHHGRTPHFKWTKTREDAVAPHKERVSDSGYDITLVDVKKQIGDIIFFSTGIKITPPFGYYFDLVPRSSLVKAGYMLANSIGILDRSFTGQILVPLIKIDKTAPDLQLPLRCMQIIPRKILHFEIVEVDSLDETERGSGGFGSTGR